MSVVIVDAAVYRDGLRSTCSDLREELERLRRQARRGDFLWIGLKNPTAAEFDTVNAGLGLHPLAVEDAVKGGQRAKVEVYEGSVFVVLKTLHYLEETSDIETGELMVFVGDRFVVTVRRGEINPLSGIRHSLEGHPELLQHGPMAVLHAVMDTVVDAYTHIDAEVSKDIEDLEEAVFSGEAVEAGAVYRLKREVLEFRRAAVPISGPVHMLHASPRSPAQDRELRLLFRDVADHLQQVLDHIESYDRLLSDMLGARLAQISVQQNNDMRRISAWVAMAAVPTMLAGIYGMNFEHMPELRWRFGYGFALTLMVVVTVSLYVTFKRSRWL